MGLKKVLGAFVFFSSVNFSYAGSLLEHASMGIYAVRSGTGDVLIDKNSNLSLMPASCMKIVTTAAALHILGPKYRFETKLQYDGFIDEEKTLHGNIYILGGGDPCLGYKRIPSSFSMQEQIDLWTQAVRAQGILRIEGRIIADTGLWEASSTIPSWTLEDVGNYYGAGSSALSFHENCYFLFFKPGFKEGDAVSILRTEPHLPKLTLHNEVKTGAEGSGDQACIYGGEFSDVQFVRGTIPANMDEFCIKGAIPNPATFCSDVFALGLAQKGISVCYKNTSQETVRHTIHTTYSPTIEEIVHLTNQKSINLYAEHLIKKMGEVAYKEGSTEAGIKSVKDFLREQKNNLDGFNMVDGSGLSRKNLITPKLLVDVLLQMKKKTVYPIFLASLPEKRDFIKAKSGSMSLVKGYAGYVGDIAFAILINQCLDSQAANEQIQSLFTDLLQMKRDEVLKSVE